MCAPVALGVASFASGALGAVGQYQSGQAQAAAANANAMSSYRHQLAMHYRQNAGLQSRYKLAKSQYKEQTYENTRAAQTAYTNEQRRVNEAFKQAAYANEGMFIDLMRKQGVVDAAGRSGKSASRIETDVMSQFGRNQALLSENLINAQQSQTIRNRAIRDQLRSQNNQAFSNVAIGPQLGIAPPKPVMQSGPSGLSLLAGLGSAAVGGFGTYKDLKAPGVF